MDYVTKDVRVAAIMTAPRYEAVYARNYIELALHTLKIPLTVSGGVFYGQCMQVMLESLVEQDVDYALTVDFDSMFTHKHVQRLLNIIASDDKIDAITSVQPKRGCGALLAAMGQETIVEWTGKPIKVSSAHFGLTVIDLKKLKDVPKPWFLSQPDKDGRWTDDKIDDDVWFWKQWYEAGRSLYVDPGCRLGHLEELVTVFDESMNLQHLYPKQWSETRDSTVD
jgi:hypothetical protein